VFVSIGILAVIVVVVVAVANGRFGARRSASTPRPPEPGASGDVTPGGGVIAQWLDRWVAAGLLTTEQGEAILAYEHSAAPVPVPTEHGRRRVPPVAEALGYLGGILAIVGIVLLIARYWPDMADGLRLTVGLVGMVVLIGAGFATPTAEAALLRLRWFLWLAATAAAGVVGGVVAHDILGFDSGARDEWRVVLGVTAGIAVVSAALWAGRERPVQQATMIGASAWAIGVLIDDLTHPGWAGLTVWVLGLGAVAVGLGTVLPVRAVWMVVGSIVAVVGGAVTSDRWMGEGLLLALVTALGWIALGSMLASRRSPGEVRPGRSLADRLRSSGPTGITVVGSVALLQLTPMTVGHFAERAGVATGVTLWAAGILAQVVADRAPIRFPLVAAIVGGVALVVGPAVTGVQSEATATVFGLATAVVLVGLGTMPGRILLSLFGSVGLLVFVPWSIAHFFPGEGRAPLLIAVSGGLIVVIAVLLARSGGRFRTELRRSGNPPPPAVASDG
jgi:hypothetical protein